MELYHYGIKGQRRGSRRYQNEDGSLTPEGILRYRKGNQNGEVHVTSPTNYGSNSLTIPIDLANRGEVQTVSKQSAPSNNPIKSTYDSKTKTYTAKGKIYLNMMGGVKTSKLLSKKNKRDKPIELPEI